MKFVPDSIARKVAQQGLLASEHAPKALFVGGVVGMVGSTVLACRATLKLEAVLDQIEHDKVVQREAKATVDEPNYEGSAVYPDSEFKQDLAVISIRGVGKIVKLYAPAAILGAVSIAALTKSHNLLQDRNLALTAAYAAIDSAYSRYRERVIDRYGEEVDRDLRYESEEGQLLDEETGKLSTTTRAIDAPGAPYARWFADWSSRNWSQHPEINLLFLKQQQNWLNDRLKSRGHVFLNEVYDALGMSHTKAGAVTGWRWNVGSGNDYIDFGIWNGPDQVVDFFYGYEGEVLLDFNVDGVIFDKIDESERG